MARGIPPKLKSFAWQTLKIGWTDFVESAGMSYPGIKKQPELLDQAESAQRNAALAG